MFADITKRAIIIMLFKYFVVTIILILSGLASNAQEVIYAIQPGRGIKSLSSFSEGLSKAKVGFEKTGFVDTTGKFIIEAVYEDAGSFHDGLAWVSKTINNHLKYGFIDKKGDLVIPFVFDEVKDFSCHRAAVRKESQWQYIDKSGKIVLNTAFIRIDTLIDKMYNGAYNEMRANPEYFKNGLLLIRRGNRFGYTDTSGRIIVPPKLYMAKAFLDGIALVAADTVVPVQSSGDDRLNKLQNKLPSNDAVVKWSVIDTTGKLLCTLDSAKAIKDLGNGLIAFTNDDDYSALWGIVNKNGKVLLAPQFEKQPISCSDGVIIVQVDGKEGDNKDGYLLTFDITGNRIAKIPLCGTVGCLYDSNLSFHEGLIAVRVANGWGYMDKAGKIVVPSQFDTALDFQGGLAIVVTTDSQVAAIRNPLKVSDVQHK
ncbi:MAG: hypothetical protein JWR38_89 [Mucilaginibacter sp.]|nr:hypothetical protein [Mucilaginibacter sp.]